MEKEPKIAIILLNYCNYKYTLNCLESLKKIIYKNYYIIIVDNKSPDNSYYDLKRYEKENIFVIQSEYNGGFAYGNNYAINFAEKIGYDYILLLNNDTLVDKNFLKELINSRSNDNTIGIRTSKIMFYPEKNKIWYDGGDVDWYNLRAKHNGYGQYEKTMSKTIKEVTFASGCCMLISKAVITDIGGLPEEYFMYYEDLDFCVNVSEKKYKILYVPTSIIYHCVSSSSGGEGSPFVIEWESRSRRKFLKKYMYYFKGYNKIYVFLKCEIRQIIKILLSNNRKVMFNAYFKSFKNVKI